jgi:hypothetical protein
MSKLIDAFNPTAALNVMCVEIPFLLVGTAIYDCDFNQMLELKVSCKDSQTHNDLIRLHLPEISRKQSTVTVLQVRK